MEILTPVTDYNNLWNATCEVLYFEIKFDFSPKFSCSASIVFNYTHYIINVWTCSGFTLLFLWRVLGFVQEALNKWVDKKKNYCVKNDFESIMKYYIVKRKCVHNKSNTLVAKRIWIIVSKRHCRYESNHCEKNIS